MWNKTLTEMFCERSVCHFISHVTTFKHFAKCFTLKLLLSGVELHSVGDSRICRGVIVRAKNPPNKCARRCFISLFFYMEKITSMTTSNAFLFLDSRSNCKIALLFVGS